MLKTALTVRVAVQRTVLSKPVLLVAEAERSLKHNAHLSVNSKLQQFAPTVRAKARLSPILVPLAKVKAEWKRQERSKSTFLQALTMVNASPTTMKVTPAKTAV